MLIFVDFGGYEGQCPRFQEIYTEVFTSNGTSCLQLNFRWFRKNLYVCMRECKLNEGNINKWGSWIKSVYEFFVLFL